MGRPSAIARLPPDLREALHAWLRDPGVTQTEAAAQLNAALAEAGQAPVSRHAVNRYDRRMRQVGERLRQSRQVADAWIARLGSRPGGQLGHLVVEMLRTLVFELTLKLQESELTAESLPAVAGQLKHLSLAAARLEKASAESAEREEKIRRAERARAAEEAAAQAEKSLAGQGLSRESVATIKREILGIAA